MKHLISAIGSFALILFATLASAAEVLYGADCLICQGSVRRITF